MKDNTKAIQDCRNGHMMHVCFDCGDKYRERKQYDGTYTCFTGICAICEESKTVSSSRKLFGFHKFI
jgi:hypothetical protein